VAKDKPQPLNTLSEAEQKAGWKLLFDGQTMAGWRGYKLQTVPDQWRVKDGTLLLEPTPPHARTHLITSDQFENFDLAFEWQIAAGGDSGVMYRVSESQLQPHESGPEYQLIDDARNSEGKNPKTRTASCFGLYAPTSDATRVAGEWNQSRIIVNGTHVAHWLNGVLVVTYELGSADWQARVKATRFKDMPRYGKEPRGHIDLQDHGDRIAFRNIKIRPLPSTGMALAETSRRLPRLDWSRYRDGGGAAWLARAVPVLPDFGSLDRTSPNSFIPSRR
jgi:Domain of Unknown Function (DUF1080)